MTTDYLKTAEDIVDEARKRSETSWVLLGLLYAVISIAHSLEDIRKVQRKG